MATRTLRKQIRRPDEFVTLTNRAVEYAQEHSRTVLWIGGAIVVAILGALALASFRQTRWEQANTSLGRAMALFAENKLPESAAAFETMARDPSNPPEFVEIARMYTAQTALRQGEFAKASAGFKEVTGVTGFLEQRTLVSSAYATEGSGQFDEAAKQFRRAIDAGGPYTAIAVLGEARNLDQAGNKAEAKKAYRKYVDDYPDAPEVSIAQSRLAALE